MKSSRTSFLLFSKFSLIGPFYCSKTSETSNSSVKPLTPSYWSDLTVGAPKHRNACSSTIKELFGEICSACPFLFQTEHIITQTFFFVWSLNLTTRRSSWSLDGAHSKMLHMTPHIPYWMRSWKSSGFFTNFGFLIQNPHAGTHLYLSTSAKRRWHGGVVS